MRFLISIIAVFSLACFPQPAAAKDQTWQTVTIPGICTYQIPPSVEIQKGTYKKYNDKYRGLLLEKEAKSDRVVAQPKGINSLDPQAFKRYCRIIVETERGSSSEYESLDEPLVVSVEELREVDSMLKQQMKQGFAMYTAKGMKMELLTWAPVKIVRVNGVDALKISYTRSVKDGPPAIVNMYTVQNDDCMHRITISYRLSEKNLWANDLDKVIDTFKFKRR